MAIKSRQLKTTQYAENMQSNDEQKPTQYAENMQNDEQKPTVARRRRRGRRGGAGRRRMQNDDQKPQPVENMHMQSKPAIDPVMSSTSIPHVTILHKDFARLLALHMQGPKQITTEKYRKRSNIHTFFYYTMFEVFLNVFARAQFRKLH
uniref:Uncharacterized protein n=1 Tax=Glossina pallidipes TaxID=7398 RepID=A0A1A9ZPU8_GLOPL